MSTHVPIEVLKDTECTEGRGFAAHDTWTKTDTFPSHIFRSIDFILMPPPFRTYQQLMLYPSQGKFVLGNSPSVVLLGAKYPAISLKWIVFESLIQRIVTFQLWKQKTPTLLTRLPANTLPALKRLFLLRLMAHPLGIASRKKHKS